VQGSVGALPDDVPPLPATREHYLEVIAGKTASLIETSCRYGAMLSGVGTEGVEAAAAYGFEVGMAFQLSDDLIDLLADAEVSGKIPGTDLREGVRTLPVLYALEDEATAGGDELATLLAGELDDADIARALELLRASDGLARARAEAAQQLERAPKRQSVSTPRARTSPCSASARRSPRSSGSRTTRSTGWGESGGERSRHRRPPRIVRR
jgi:heptaprenyl diphosphate synthase